MNEYKYRILTEDQKIKFTGSSIGSWFQLHTARELVDRSKGETIYEYDNEGRPMWEVF